MGGFTTFKTCVGVKVSAASLIREERLISVGS